MLTSKILTAMAASMAAICVLAACSDGAPKPAADALVVLNGKSLTRAELDANMPAGLNADDSARYARAYARQWIDARLASEIASREIDMEAIDRMVEQYRNDLIMFEYGKRMYDAQAQDIPEDSLVAYYEAHPDEFVLSRPMVKGVYLKVIDGAKSLPTLRRLYRSQKDSDIDNLDKSQLDGAVHYDYFRDKWIDWEQIEQRVPYDFGPSADAFLRQKKNLDFSQGGFTYLLDITDVLSTGQTMPYEAARQQIIDRLQFAERRAYSLQLKKDLYDKAIADGQLTILCDLD